VADVAGEDEEEELEPQGSSDWRKEEEDELEPHGSSDWRKEEEEEEVGDLEEEEGGDNFNFLLLVSSSFVIPSLFCFWSDLRFLGDS